MKKFEYFISYAFIDRNNGLGFGSGNFLFDYDLDKNIYNPDPIKEAIKSASNRSLNEPEILKVTIMYYRLRRIIKE